MVKVYRQIYPQSGFIREASLESYTLQSYKGLNHSSVCFKYLAIRVRVRERHKQLTFIVRLRRCF